MARIVSASAPPQRLLRVVLGQHVDDGKFAGTLAPYAHPGNTGVCSVCHECFKSCKRYSDSSKYRFKGCFGTSVACDRGPSMEDLNGELTFEGEPFQSRLTSLRFNGFDWSGAVEYRTQTNDQNTLDSVDWKCYADRYGLQFNMSKFIYDEAGALAHWKSRSDWPGQCKTQSNDRYTGQSCRKTADCGSGEACVNSPAGGDEVGLLWGCFNGYWKDAANGKHLEAEDFVLNQMEGALGIKK